MNRELAILASYYLSLHIVFLFKSTFPVDFSLFLQFAIASIASPLPYVNRLVSIKSPKERAFVFSFLLRKSIYLSVIPFPSSRNRSSGRTSFKVPSPGAGPDTHSLVLIERETAISHRNELGHLGLFHFTTIQVREGKTSLLGRGYVLQEVKQKPMHLTRLKARRMGLELELLHSLWTANVRDKPLLM